jgi:hypothetical protein
MHIFEPFYNIEKRITCHKNLFCTYLQDIFPEIAMLGHQLFRKHCVMTHICKRRGLLEN